MAKKETITALLKRKGISTRIIKAIKAGYEGIYWNASASVFLDNFYGSDILLKASMVYAEGYRSWHEGLSTLREVDARILKQISGLF